MLVHACLRERKKEMSNLASDTETIAFPKIDDRRLALLKTLGDAAWQKN